MGWGKMAAHATPKVMKLLVLCHSGFVNGLPNSLCCSFCFSLNLLGLLRHVNGWCGIFPAFFLGEVRSFSHAKSSTVNQLWHIPC